MPLGDATYVKSTRHWEQYRRVHSPGSCCTSVAPLTWKLHDAEVGCSSGGFRLFVALGQCSLQSPGVRENVMGYGRVLFIRTNDDREQSWVWNGVHSASLSTTEELLERISNGSGLENREHGRRDLLRWPRGALYPKKLALTSLTSSGHSVDIVRWRPQATEFSFNDDRERKARHFSLRLQSLKRSSILSCYTSRGAVDYGPLGPYINQPLAGSSY
jgi:hypothetical protein